MIPFEQAPAETLSQIRYVLCDIDDTITCDGKLPAASYTALWRLFDAGIAVIPITGRPAGWCDLIVRQWPVRAVLGENGAFVYYFDHQQLCTYTHPSVAVDPQPRLREILEACMAAVPGCRPARDQFSRKYDVAIDFCEDPPRLSLRDAEKIKAVCESFGASAKISSIHVNAWFGSYDKVTTARLFFRDVLQEPDPEGCAIFFGDSPNDEPMFAHFPLSCAVANIVPFVGSLSHLPTYVTRGQSADGFVEAVNRILSVR